MSPFFDPDRRLWSRDKLWHVLGGAGIELGGVVFVPWWGALIVTALVGAAYELGQWDAVRGEIYLVEPQELAPHGVRALGHVGYGFGLLDLAADLVGALVVVMILALV